MPSGSDHFTSRLDAAIAKCRVEVQRKLDGQIVEARPVTAKRPTPATSAKQPPPTARPAAPERATAEYDDGDFSVRIELQLKKTRGRPGDAAKGGAAQPSTDALATPARVLPHRQPGAVARSAAPPVDDSAASRERARPRAEPPHRDDPPAPDATPHVAAEPPPPAIDDPQLARLVRAWPRLSPQIREMVLGIARA